MEVIELTIFGIIAGFEIGSAPLCWRLGVNPVRYQAITKHIIGKIVIWRSNDYLNSHYLSPWRKDARVTVFDEDKFTRGAINGIHPLTVFIPPPNEVGGGILDSPCPSVCPSVRPSVCRRHGFRSISQVCFGISISNFICMLMVAIGRSLLIFSDVTFKMAAWRPYWIIWFPDSNFTLALNFNFKLQRHNTYIYG